MRILPPYYIAVALLTLLSLFTWGQMFYSDTEPKTIVTTLNELFFLDLNGNYHSPAFWTLAVELRWYFYFPLMIWLYGKSKRAFMALLVITLFYLPATRVGMIDIYMLPYFLAGICAADLSITQPSWTRLAWIALLFCIADAIITQTPNGAGYYLSWTWGISAFLLVVVAGQCRILRAALHYPAFAISELRHIVFILCINQCWHTSRKLFMCST